MEKKATEKDTENYGINEQQSDGEHVGYESKSDTFEEHHWQDEKDEY